MSLKTLSEIEAEVRRLAAKINAPESALPTFGHTEDAARPHVEADAHGYHFVVVERGEELRRDSTADLNELLYCVFESIAFSLACRYELDHRVHGEDCRRMLFARQVELLGLLSESWGERRSREHQQILGRHPFNDQ